MKEAFENYTKNYDMNDPDIAYKYNHSYRVMALSRWLSEELGLSKKDIEIATIIGLYHDIGRFEEDKRFDNFGVHQNFDHGDYGKEVLLKEELIKQIPIEGKYYNLIAKAVETHNKYEIKKGLNEKTTLHCKIIRDTDKIDILRSAAEGIMLEKNFNRKAKAEEISAEVKKQFYNNSQIIKRKKSKNSETNKIITLLAYVYDINFIQTFEYLKKYKILDNIYNLLEDKEGFKEYFDYADEYIKRRMKDVRN